MRCPYLLVGYKRIYGATPSRYYLTSTRRSIGVENRLFESMQLQLELKWEGNSRSASIDESKVKEVDDDCSRHAIY